MILLNNYFLAFCAFLRSHLISSSHLPAAKPASLRQQGLDACVYFTQPRPALSGLPTINGQPPEALWETQLLAEKPGRLIVHQAVSAIPSMMDHVDSQRFRIEAAMILKCERAVKNSLKSGPRLHCKSLTSHFDTIYGATTALSGQAGTPVPWNDL